MGKEDEYEVVGIQTLFSSTRVSVFCVTEMILDIRNFVMCASPQKHVLRKTICSKMGVCMMPTRTIYIKVHVDTQVSTFSGRF